MSRSFVRAVALSGALFALSLGLASGARAQDRLKIGGTAFLDYYYQFQDTSAQNEGENGFQYRRIYLTADYAFSDEFAARIRFESSLSNPAPFAKDLYLRWKAPSGHRVTAGIAPTPGNETEDAAWGFRSLEQGTFEFFGALPSRDFGVRVDGPILPSGRLRYDVMFGNNSRAPQETDKYKRAYAQLEARPTEHTILSVGGDYARFRDRPLPSGRISGLAAYVSPDLRLGIESFASQTGLRVDDGPSGEPKEWTIAVGGFAAGWFSPRWGVVGRLDHAFRRNSRMPDRTLAIAGLVYRPHEQIRIIPNLHYVKDEAADLLLQGRATVEFSF